MNNINRYGKLLPIGSVVKIKKIDKKIMIISILSLGEKDKLYDYAGCLFPEGCLTGNKNILFDKEDIEKIYYTGYIDNEEIEFKKNINDYVETIKSALKTYREGEK